MGFLSEALACVFAPARAAVFPQITGQHLYAKGLSLSLTAGEIVRVLGPTVASVAVVLLLLNALLQVTAMISYSGAGVAAKAIPAATILSMTGTALVAGTALLTWAGPG